MGGAGEERGEGGAGQQGPESVQRGPESVLVIPEGRGGGRTAEGASSDVDRSVELVDVEAIGAAAASISQLGKRKSGGGGGGLVPQVRGGVPDEVDHLVALPGPSTTWQILLLLPPLQGLVPHGRLVYSYKWLLDCVGDMAVRSIDSYVV